MSNRGKRQASVAQVRGVSPLVRVLRHAVHVLPLTAAACASLSSDASSDVSVDAGMGATAQAVTHPATPAAPLATSVAQLTVDRIRRDFLIRTVARESAAPLGMAELTVAQLVPKGEALKLDIDGGRIYPTFAKEPETRVELPLFASDAVQLAHKEHALSIRLIGASAARATRGDDAVVYSNVFDSATMVHIPTRTGTEEFVRFDKPPAKRELRYAVSTSKIAGFRVYSGALEALAEDGNPIFHTTAPIVVDSNGKAVRGSIALEGCAYDGSDRPPWGRLVTRPGNVNCTVVTSWDDSTLTYPILVDPAWTTAGTMIWPRQKHSAAVFTRASYTACASGCVLVTGGQDATAAAIKWVELYSVSAKTWTAVMAMPGGARFGHASIGTGGDGRVVAGGGTRLDSTGAAVLLSDTQLYDPSAPVPWKVLGDLTLPRANFTMVSAETNVIATAGDGASDTNLLELPATTWALMPTAPSSGTGVKNGIYHAFWSVDPDNYGYVVAGGTIGSAANSTVFFYSGGDGTWETRGSLSTSRVSPGWAPLDDRIIIAGGAGGTSSAYLDTVEQISTLTLTVSPVAGVLSRARDLLVGAPVGSSGSRRALFVGGRTPYTTSDSSDVVTSTGAIFSGSMSSPRVYHQATPLPDGSVLVTGGADSGGTALGSALFTLQANGAACAQPAECISGNCVDGYCCNTSCTSQCAACDVAGALGTCSAVTGAPHGPASRGVCALAGTACGAACDGVTTTSCNYAYAGAACSSASCPTQSESLPAATCSGTGVCISLSKISCGLYACNAVGGACRTTCSVNSDCSTGNRCNSVTRLCESSGGAGGACAISSDCVPGLSCVDGVCCTVPSCTAPLRCNVPGAAGSCKLPSGSACTASTASSCGSGVCADGVCCNSACSGQCEACDVGGSIGTCIPAVGAPRGSRPGCVGTGACQGSCDGSDRLICKSFPGIEKICSAASCSGSVNASEARCNGSGTCSPATIKSCAPYTCGAVGCRTLCASPAECTAGYTCKDGICKATGSLGTPCTATTDCNAGTYCTTGEGPTKVCCKTATCGAGEYCGSSALVDKYGQCVGANGTPCTTGASCATGFCVDGVCCSNLCNGQCEACDVSGALGKCIQVKGSPHGGRTTCSSGGGNICRAAMCDGIDPLKCAAFKNGVETECATAVCVDNVASDSSHCNGSGTCEPGTSKSCVPFVCGDKICKRRCVSSADCIAGYVCDMSTSMCVPSNSTCSTDGLSSISNETLTPRACAPYRCDPGNGACATRCDASADCRHGFDCEGNRCVTSGSRGDAGDVVPFYEAGTEPEKLDSVRANSCAYARGETSGANGGNELAAMLVAVGLGCRRRRRRST